MIERLLEDDVARAMRAAFNAPVPLPVLVENVLDPTVAEELTYGLASLDGWRAEHFLEEFLGGTKRVAAEEFESASALARFASWQTIDLDSGPQHSLLAPLLHALSSRTFLDHLRSLGPSGIGEPRFKLRRYGPGDFFAAHTDGSSGMGVLIYLTDPPWQEGDGGCFVYESPSGTSRFPPRFNSALVFPYQDDAPHHVEPVSPTGSIRYTLGCDYA